MIEVGLAGGEEKFFRYRREGQSFDDNDDRWLDFRVSLDFLRNSL